MTEVAAQTQTQAAYTPTPPYYTPGPTPTLGTPDFLDPFATPMPSRTPGINLACPSEEFDTEGLDYDWAMVCGACIRDVRGTPTPLYGIPPLSFPSLNLSTFTPSPTALMSPTPSNTLVPSATPTPYPTATATPPGGCGWSFLFDFNGFAWNPPVSTMWLNSMWDGTGYVDGDGGADGFNNYFRGCGVDITFPQVGNVTQVKIVYDLAKGIYTNGAAPALESSPGGSVTHPNTTAGSNVTRIFSGFSSNVSSVAVRIYASIRTGSYGGGTCKLRSVELSGIGTNPFTGQVGCPVATATPTHTPTPTNTPLPGDPTATPEWWATSFPQYAGLSVDCSEPRYIDFDRPLMSAEIGASESDPVCLTVLPYLNIGFDLINATAGQIFGFQIPAIIFQQVNVCFVGIAVVVNILGFQLDMAILIGVPMLAYLLRWVLFQ